ncbi:hypothetical protein QQ054_32430 [Oscillatoria amoena NRMC-F 0135]|nr:hypothetical protein [Oscillatoria amoena NRMC-F 0135]
MKTEKPIMPWKRFWCRFGGIIHVGHETQGFLSDPEGEFTKLYNPELFTLDQLATESCLILCGDPGIGKSTVIQQHKDALKSSLGEGGHFIPIDFRDVPSDTAFTRWTFDSHDWQKWKASTDKLLLVVDGVDEGLVKIPGFVSFLAASLRNEPLDRLKLILACRSAEWPVNEGEQLISLFGRFEKPPIYELCPLRQCDAKLAAETMEINPHNFIQSVYQQKVVGMAALPTTLFFLLNEFQGGGGFSSTHRQLYERGCKRLSQEIDARRVETLRQLQKTERVSSPEKIYDAAKRLAALYLVCGKSAIHTGQLEDADATSDLHISQAADLTLTKHVMGDAIASALFTSRGPNRFGFAHQTFAECLASQFLSSLPLAQIRSALCARDGQEEHVIPQLAETAAWVACARKDFFDHLCLIEPEVLLRSDVSIVDNSRKIALVTAVLEKVKRAELFDDRNISRFFSSLKHPELAVQLQPYITDKSLHIVVRRMGMSIARDCKEISLVDVFFSIIQDTTEDQSIREHAASSLVSLIPSSRLDELIPLALGQVGEDPDNRMRGYALQKLIPQIWSVSQALPAIQDKRDDVIGDSYWYLLHYHLPVHLNVSDLSSVLERMIRWTNCFDALSWFRELAEAAFTMALKNLGKDDIRKLAVRVWVEKSQHYHPLPNSKESSVVKLLYNDKNLRHEFLASILNDSETPSDISNHIVVHYDISIYLYSDLEWALNQLIQCPTDRRIAWANLISCTSPLDATCEGWSLFLQRIEEIPELKSKFIWLRAWDLNEPTAREAKAQWLRRERSRRRFAEPKNEFNLEINIQAALADITAGQDCRWIKLCYLLACKNDETHFSHLNHDMTEYPGWKAADEARRNQIRSAARVFLLKHSDGFAEIGTHTNFFDPGCVAVWLLKNELSTDIELKTAVTTKWIEALVGQFNGGGEDYQNIAALAYELNPDTTLQAFIRELKNADQKDGQIHDHIGFKKAWDSRFTSATLDLISEGTLKAKSIETLLTFLGSIAPSEAFTCARELLTHEAVTNTTLQDRTVGVLASCIGAMPAVTWDFAWPIIETDSSIAEKVLLRVSYRFDYDPKKFLTTLSERQLADFYLKLQCLFPPETDPQPEKGASFIKPRDSMVHFRDDVINALESRGTDTACDELLRLANALPKEGVWLRWRLYNARLSKQRSSWCPPSPETFLLLSMSTKGHLVRDADDLLEVIMESLARYQVMLTQNTRSERFWNWDGADNNRENFRHKDEAFLCDEIRSWLHDDLSQSGIIINREVQIRRGKRTDIHVNAVAQGESNSSMKAITLVIEVKGCWNAEVKTAVDSQLVGDYLRPSGLSHGIYLVGWFVSTGEKSSPNKLKSKTFEDAQCEIGQLVSPYDGKAHPERVAGLVLDCRYPEKIS